MANSTNDLECERRSDGDRKMMSKEYTLKKVEKYKPHQRQACGSAFGVHDQATIGRERMICQPLPLDLATKYRLQGENNKGDHIRVRQRGKKGELSVRRNEREYLL